MSKTTKIWWHEYRKRNNRPNILNMSTEIIFRKIFTRTIKEYVSECSIGGIRSIISPEIGLMKRLICTMVFITLFSCIFYFLWYIWINNLATPFMVTMETTAYPIRNIDFPAVALCNFNRISKKALENFVIESYASLVTQNETIGEVKWFARQLGRLIDHTHHPPRMLNPLLMSFAKYLGDTHNITKLMRQLAPSCEDMLLKCAWSAKLVDCNSIFKLHRTIHGHCCAFNYVLGYDSGKFNTTIKTLERQTSPGPNYGLNIILDPMVDDYEYPLYNLFGFEVLIFDPTHFADPTGGRVKQLIMQPGQLMFFEVQSTKQIATSEVRKYSKQSRKCLFQDEAKDKFNNLYSYSSCIINCRIKTMQALCKCTPYYLSISPEHGPVCTLDNLKCLNKYKEKFYYLYPIDTIDTSGLESEIQNSLYCPDCRPDCETTQHNMRRSKIPLISEIKYKNKQFARRFLSGLNLSSTCVLSIYQATAAGVLNRLDVVLYWFEVLSNIGGYCGILVGLSIISIIELLYFLFKFVIIIVKIFSGKGEPMY